MGKTTLARRLAYRLVIDGQSNPLTRIPILIRLGEISAEQSLEGLLPLCSWPSIRRRMEVVGVLQK
jgi:hypothetical protein